MIVCGESGSFGQQSVKARNSCGEIGRVTGCSWMGGGRSEGREDRVDPTKMRQEVQLVWALRGYSSTHESTGEQDVDRQKRFHKPV